MMQVVLGYLAEVACVRQSCVFGRDSASFRLVRGE